MKIRQKMIFSLLAVLMLAVFAVPARADYDLQITEIWCGQNGDDVTADWFEITNCGTTAWTSGDGNLYYDDDSKDASTADLMSGIVSIDPCESVVFVIGDSGDVSDFHTVWDGVLSGFQVGCVDGAGLGQGGDGVTLWVGTPSSGSYVDYESYGDVSNNDGQSWDVVLGEFSTVGNAAGAVATEVLGGGGDDVLGSADDFTPAIGSPGQTSCCVPEPSTFVLALMGLAALAALLRRSA